MIFALYFLYFLLWAGGIELARKKSTILGCAMCAVAGYVLAIASIALHHAA